MNEPRPKGQIAVSVGVVLLGGFILVGAWSLPAGGGYAQVGPGVVPRVVGGALLFLGAMLLREALTGGYRGVDEEAEVHLPMDWKAFGWVTAGIIVYGLLVERAGFLVASTLLFIAVARGFASRRWILNACVGLAISSFIFAVFNYGLGLQLPPGVLRGVLP